MMQEIFRDNPLVKMRKAAGMTRALLGRETGLPYQTIVQIERNMTNSIRPSTAERLAAVFGMSAQELADTFKAYRQSNIKRKPATTQSLAATVEAGANQ